MEKPKWPYAHRVNLFPHANGSWAKKIKGKLHYFGPWADPKAALEKFLAEQEDLYAGKQPKAVEADLTVRQMVNAFLTMKHQRWQDGELSASMFGDYKEAGDFMVKTLGAGTLVADLTPDDFSRFRRAIKGGVVTKNSRVSWIRSFFNWAFRSGLIDRPPRYGDEFSKPTKRALRINKQKRHAENGKPLFTREEILKLIALATGGMRAMILLGINCGFGNKDVASLRRSQLDLEKGWVELSRAKTGILRRSPLWPETIAAINAYNRPAPKSKADADLIFLTRHGNPFVRDIITRNAKGLVKDAHSHNGVVLEFIRLMEQTTLRMRGFYSLRHTFRTVADEVADDRAIDRIMGHVSAHISAEYVERIADVRLQKVSDHVRLWLFNKTPGSPAAPFGEASSSESPAPPAATS